MVWEFLKSLKWTAWLAVFLSFVGLGWLDGIVTEALESALRSANGTPTTKLITLGVASISLGLIFPALMVSFAFSLHRWVAPASGLAIFRQSLIETMRAWGQVFLRLMLFVLPGLWRMVEIVFVPIVVGQSFAYHRGALDAPSLSAKIMRQTWVRSLLAVSFFYMFVPFIASSYFAEYKSLSEHPLGFALHCLGDTLFFLLGTAVLVSIAKTAPAMCSSTFSSASPVRSENPT